MASSILTRSGCAKDAPVAFINTFVAELRRLEDLSIRADNTDRGTATRKAGAFRLVAEHFEYLYRGEQVSEDCRFVALREASGGPTYRPGPKQARLLAVLGTSTVTYAPPEELLTALAAAATLDVAVVAAEQVSAAVAERDRAVKRASVNDAAKAELIVSADRVDELESMLADLRRELAEQQELVDYMRSVAAGEHPPGKAPKAAARPVRVRS